jgi:56kDa selenium binding protein (SBP56)
LAGVLLLIQQQTYGSLLLGVTAAGLFGFGIYEVAEAAFGHTAPSLHASGGLELAKDYWVSFPDGYRAHQIRLEGGDCSTDSFCYPSAERIGHPLGSG